MVYKYLRSVGRSFLKLFNAKLVKIIPDKSEEILSRFAKENEGVKFLQIGGNDGISHDCLYQIVLKHKWQGVVVEPLDEFFRKLQLNYSFYDKVEPVRYAIHPTEQEMIMFKLNPLKYGDYGFWAGGIASFNKKHLISHNILDEDIIEEVVPCINLMKLIFEKNLKDLDYLQIDTEGFDFQILKMIDFKAISPKLIRFEYASLSESELSESKEILKNYTLEQDGSDVFAHLRKKT